MNTVPTEHADWLVILPVILPLMAGALAIALRSLVRMQSWFAILVLLVELALNLALFDRVSSDGILSLTMGNWLPPFGISFTVDVLGALLALTSTFVCLVCCLFAFADIDKHTARFGFYPMLLVLVCGLNGAFLTGDIFNLYVWLEVLLICTFGLIIQGGTRVQLDGALKYAFLNLVATTIFLVATGLLYGAVGTLNFADLVTKVPAYSEQGLIAVIAFLYLFALAMKSAAFPLFFWLPASYHTPKFVVSALFAGLLTKVGVYGIYRIFSAVFAAGPLESRPILLWVAGLTMVVGAIGALAQSELRRMLGFLVVSGIGFMLLGFALDSEAGRAAGIFYIVQSMLVTSGLYLLAGLARSTSGQAQPGGLYARAPLVAALFLVLGFATAGLPPFSGFWPKFMLVRDSLDQGLGWAAAAVLLAGFFSTLAIARTFAATFWAPARAQPGKELVPAPPLSWAMLVPVVVLAAAALGLGLLPAPLYDVTAVAARGLGDYQPYVAAVFGAGQ
ncbi:multicomponent Na+:H+ antiporter subunit D [Rhodoligotrophos appendicifer]|uniref:Na+/H+ antiporter subunit D n=1 Tax=Rhodoligotrophos appendicifer TaxID=987056 RepID=UPI001185CB77|nr:Na+/H+ antiporter subunit D [Rhodoligotrophos appendicifer]